ncbi:PrpF protein [Tsuneonella suprasediminis]|uniref:PrpF protein n=1 Tax=Tsuneonella suprasediminis TaxID=2306996 RepID=A0A419R433_9SPHN|nr:PrpF domain-containing protein [Tsuneonella suprasediminis]RJX69120.1 PrpF protein [Tsuneonella suprasediminis]
MADQITLPCVLMRAGTSKGPFLHARDLPPPGPERDAMLIRLMGSPDLIQIDGLGGSRPITSKIAIISPSARDDADVDYLFAQVDIDSASISYSGNCGNISSGVGPFAIDEGLVPGTGPTTQVRIYNVNTDKILTAIVPVADGRARVTGDFTIPGVPGTGAEIVLDYTATTGAKTGRLLPTGAAENVLTLEDGRRIRFTLCDMGNPCVWVPAEDLGMEGIELAAQIDGDPALLATVHEIRGKVAVAGGMIARWQDVDLGLPMLGIVSPPQRYTTSDGAIVTADDIDLCVRLLFMGRMHESLAGTSSVSVAAASRIPGSTVAQAARIADPKRLRAGHPLGSMPVTVVAKSDSTGGITFTSVGFSRTARRLLAGTAYLPA